MISLSHAFRLCEVDEETVWFRHVSERANRMGRAVALWAPKVRQKVDMQRVKVVRIRPHYSRDGYEGLEFIVCGIAPERLLKYQYM